MKKQIEFDIPDGKYCYDIAKEEVCPLLQSRADGEEYCILIIAGENLEIEKVDKEKPWIYNVIKSSHCPNLQENNER